MKKHIVLTSVVAIAISCPAMATTDVTFSGAYNNGASKIADGVADTTYDYVRTDGTTATGVAYDADPVLTDFTYTDKDGNLANLSTGTPVQSDFAGTTAADGVNVKSTQEIVSGATASRGNYTYVNGAGDEVTLGEVAQDMVATHTLSDYAGGVEIVVTNGDVTDEDFSGKMYSFETVSGQIVTLNDDGTGILNNGFVAELDPTSQADLDKFAEVQSAYNADKIAIENAKTTTGANWTTEQTNFNAASDVFTADSNKIAELDGYFASVGVATDALAAAQDAQQVAADAYVANGELYQAAKDVYDAPILETISNGAKAEIDNSLAENGAIDVALDSMRDEAEEIFADKQQWVDNTLGIESANSNAVSDALTGEIAGDETTFSGAINTIDDAVSQNTADIVTNAENIAANKTAIETNATDIAANRVAIEEEVANRIAGDEMTLASAKAYVDSKNELALKSAYDYTDHKVGALEEDLSAGIASAAAMSSVAVSGVGKGEVSVGGGYGYYNSQSAVALGAAMGISDNWSINAAAGLADSNVTFRAGTNYKFKLF